MKKLFLVFILLLGVSFAQQSKNRQSVELPEFVILGQNKVSVSKANKIKPDFLSVVSNEFLKPEYLPEEILTGGLSDPDPLKFNLFDSTGTFRGFIEAGAGIYSLPKGKISYIYPFQNGIFEGSLSGENQREYLPNTDFQNIDGVASVSLFTNRSASFLPATQFKFYGGYKRNSYNFFGSAISDFNRKLSNGFGGVQINNLLNPHFIFSVDISDNFSNISDENFKENLLNVKSFIKTSVSNFALAVNLDYKRQNLTNNLVSSKNFNYFFIRSSLGFDATSLIRVQAGVNYFNSGGTNNIYPYGSVAIKLNNSLTLFGEYSPSVELLTNLSFLEQNKYFIPQQFINKLVKYSNSFKASIKYEYRRILEIDAGAQYNNSPFYPYFSESSTKGFFTSLDADAESIGGFVNLFFHLGRFGYFYSSAEYNNTTDNNGNTIPYHPKAKANLVYGYEFLFGLKAELDVYYNSKSYADLQNTKEVKQFFDAGLNFDYKLMQNFSVTLKVNNLSDHKNFYWLGYQEKPVDVIAGIKYRW